MVLAGHNHHYERSQKDGVSYVVTGGGGAKLADFESLGSNPYSLVRVKVHQYVTLDVGCKKGTMMFNALDTQDGQIDGPLVLWPAEQRILPPLILRTRSENGQEAIPPALNASGSDAD